MPRTAPAIAVATSQRTISPAMSIGSSSSIRMTGSPAFASASARSVASLPSPATDSAMNSRSEP